MVYNYKIMNINLLDVPVYYINSGDQDIKKVELTQRVLKRFGFKNTISFEGTWSNIPKVGCAKSHLDMIEKILGDSSPVLIVEDDIYINNLITEIDIPDDSDAVYLGNSLFGLSFDTEEVTSYIVADKINKDIYRIYNMLGAHAVLLITQKYKDHLFKEIKKQIIIQDNQDKARARTMRSFNVYCFNDPLFYQLGKNTSYTKILVSDHSITLNEYLQ